MKTFKELEEARARLTSKLLPLMLDVRAGLRSPLCPEIIALNHEMTEFALDCTEYSHPVVSELGDYLLTQMATIMTMKMDLAEMK
jgi:hypothetical protein